MMNPIFASSARKRMRSIRTPILLTLYGAFLIVLVYIYALSLLTGATVRIDTMSAGIEGYIYTVAFQLVVIVLIAPAMTSTCISGERERQTLDLLLVTHTGSFSIALGKLLEGFSFLALLILSGLPAMSVYIIYGVVGLPEIFMTILFMMAVALISLAVGICASALFKRSITSTVVTYIALAVVGFGFLLSPALVNPEAYKSLLSPDGTLTQLTIRQVLWVVPIVFWMSPITGALALLASQTGVLQRTFLSYTGRNALFTELFDQVRFDYVAWANMALLTMMAFLLLLLAAAFIRPRVKSIRRGRE